jgi:hypothetical protein
LFCGFLQGGETPEKQERFFTQGLFRESPTAQEHQHIASLGSSTLISAFK